MNIYESIAAVMAAGYSIAKDKTNKQQGFAYRGIDDVLNTFQPLLAANHIFFTPEVVEHKREERAGRSGGVLIYTCLLVRYTFYAEDGTCVSCLVPGEGMDSGDKSTGKAMSAALKYAMFQMFCIPTEEMPDGDAESPEPAPRKKPIPLCADCGKPITAAGKYSAEKIAESALRSFGMALCMDCGKKHSANRAHMTEEQKFEEKRCQAQAKLAGVKG